MPRVGVFGDSLSADVLFLRDSAGANHPCLSIVDDASLLHQAVRLESRQPSHVWSLFVRCWLQLYRPPIRLLVDRDGRFEGEFLNGCAVLSIDVEFIAGGAHYQLGRAERHGAALRHIAQRLFDDFQVTNVDEFDTVLAAVCHAKTPIRGQPLHDRLRS